MQLGVNTAARGALGTREAYMKVAQLADRVGFDFLSVSDHVLVPAAIGSTYPYSEGGKWETATATGYCLEELATLCFLAGCTEKLKLLTSVMVVPHRPAVLTAKILSTADVLSNGRMILGVGAGWLREEFEALQTDPYDARGRVTDEYIKVFKELWEQQAPSFDGEFVKFSNIQFEPKPYGGRRIPVWVGGESNPALRRTARLGDAWYPGSRNPKHRLDTPERLVAGVDRLKKLAEAEGRDPATIEIAYVVLSPLSWQAEPGHDTPRRLMTGSVDEIADDIRGFAKVGVKHFNISFPAGDISEMCDAIQKFAEEVMPQVRWAGPMSQRPDAIVYVSCSKGDCIDVLSLDRENGSLSRLDRMTLGGNGMPLALAPDGRHLYAVVYGDNAGTPEPRYQTHAIDPENGRLERMAITPAPGRMSHITLDRSGRFLFGASVANDLISVHVIGDDNVIRPEPLTVREVPSKAHQIATDPANAHAYVPNLGAALVMQLHFDAATGVLSDNEPAQLKLHDDCGPRHMAHHPDGRFVYILCEFDGALITCVRDGRTGLLTQVHRTSYLPAGFSETPWGADIHVTPDGSMLFTSERTSSTVGVHVIDPDSGRPQLRTSIETEECPRNFAVDPSGRWLIVAGEKSDRVSSYKIDQATGSVELSGTRETGIGPVWVEVLAQTDNVQTTGDQRS